LLVVDLVVVVVVVDCRKYPANRHCELGQHSSAHRTDTGPLDLSQFCP
jgi:hypothetical protein